MQASYLYNFNKDTEIPALFYRYTCIMKKLLLLLLILVTIKAQAQTEEARLKELLFGHSLFHKSPLYKHDDYGVSIGIINGRHIYFIHSGRQAGSDLPVDSATLFEVGSVTKTFTGLLLAQQMVNHRIRQNAYMDAYLPAQVKLHPDLRRRVKITDLASHQSGLPNLSNDEYINALFKQNPVQPFSLTTPAYIYQILNKTTALNGYGTYQYNNYAYALLGLILQQSAHTTYAQLLQRQLLTPLKLTHTRLSAYSSRNVAGRFDSKGQPQPVIVANAIAPAGGLRSNAMDMLKYVQYQLNPPVMARKAVALTHQRFHSDDKHVIGLGWDIFPDYLEKSGDTFGNSSLLRFSTRKKLGVVVLSDHQDSQFVEDVANRIFKELE